MVKPMFTSARVDTNIVTAIVEALTGLEVLPRRLRG